MDLATRVKPALDLIGRSGTTAATPPASAAPAPATLDGARLTAIVGAPGVQTGAVYKITIGRPDLKITEMSAAITSRIGLNTWAAFVGTDAHAAIAGDIAMLPAEITLVLKALRAHGLSVVASHQHMTTTEPTVYFLHYWGTGTAEDLAAGFKAARDLTRK